MWYYEQMLIQFGIIIKKPPILTTKKNNERKYSNMIGAEERTGCQFCRKKQHIFKELLNIYGFPSKHDNKIFEKFEDRSFCCVNFEGFNFYLNYSIYIWSVLAGHEGSGQGLNRFMAVLTRTAATLPSLRRSPRKLKTIQPCTPHNT